MEKKEKTHKWILYITIPLTIIFLALCITWMYSSSHPFVIRMEMDDNSLEAVRIAKMPLECDDSITYYVKENTTLKQIDCTNGKIINVEAVQ